MKSFGRYFFSSFLQVQLFDGMCRRSGQRLSQCDIYGSKKAGDALR